MNELRITMDTRVAEREISKLLHNLENSQELLKVIAAYLKAATKRFFRGPRPDRSAVDGVIWPPIKDETIKRKRAKGQPDRPMVATGEGRDSIKVIRLDKKSLIYGTEILSKKGFPYMGYHNYTRFPFLFINKKRLADILSLTIDWIKYKRPGL